MWCHVKRLPLNNSELSYWRRPTASPTPAPTPFPSYSPTPMPTSLPTSLPTALPTSAPTPGPTSIPSPLPSLLPSPLPSGLPTPAPTGAPSPLPSAAPSPLPTRAPTPPPSETPTPAPTSLSWAPSPVPTAEPRYSVSAAVTMSGMECSDYGTAEESAFVSGLASTLDGIETDHIGDTECDDVSRRRTQAAGDEGGAEPEQRRELTSAVSIAFDITIAVSEVTHANVSDGASLATSISSGLSTAISSGSLTSAIVSAASPSNSTSSSSAFSSVSVTGHTITTQAPTPSPTASPTPSPTRSPTALPTPPPSHAPVHGTEGLAWWVWAVVALFGALLLGVAGHVWCKRRADEKKVSRSVVPDFAAVANDSPRDDPPAAIDVRPTLAPADSEADLLDRELAAFEATLQPLAETPPATPPPAAPAAQDETPGGPPSSSSLLASAIDNLRPEPAPTEGALIDCQPTTTTAGHATAAAPPAPALLRHNTMGRVTLAPLKDASSRSSLPKDVPALSPSKEVPALPQASERWGARSGTAAGLLGVLEDEQAAEEAAFIEQVRRFFADADADGSGALSRSEFPDVVRAMNLNLPDAELQSIFDRAGEHGVLTLEDAVDIIKTEVVKTFGSLGNYMQYLSGDIF